MQQFCKMSALGRKRTPVSSTVETQGFNVMEGDLLYSNLLDSFCIGSFDRNDSSLYVGPAFSLYHSQIIFGLKNIRGHSLQPITTQ